jgi:hypothetical protein
VESETLPKKKLKNEPKNENSEVRKFENGKWKMENGKWKMENGKWKMENGK